MNRKITIDPVTRVEGHGRVTIHLDEYGQVKDSFFHIVEFRGFERFIQGHPYWEAPVLVQTSMRNLPGKSSSCGSQRQLTRLLVLIRKIFHLLLPNFAG